MNDVRLRNRLIICWMMASALWIAGFSIFLAFITPAPGFAVVAPIAFGVPAVLLIALLVFIFQRGRTGR